MRGYGGGFGLGGPSFAFAWVGFLKYHLQYTNNGICALSSNFECHETNLPRLFYYTLNSSK